MQAQNSLQSQQIKWRLKILNQKEKTCLGLRNSSLITLSRPETLQEISFQDEVVQSLNGVLRNGNVLIIYHQPK